MISARMTEDYRTCAGCSRTDRAHAAAIVLGDITFPLCQVCAAALTGQLRRIKWNPKK